MSALLTRSKNNKKEGLLVRSKFVTAAYTCETWLLKKSEERMSRVIYGSVKKEGGLYKGN